MRSTIASLAVVVVVALLAACTVPDNKFVATVYDAAVQVVPADANVDSNQTVCAADSPCCNTEGQLLGAEAVCATRTEYRCEGTCGGKPQQRTVEQHCTGASVACDGPEVATDYIDIPGTPACGAAQFCDTDRTEAPECTTCPGGCTNGTCAGVQCTSGACCDDGQFEGPTSECSSALEYRCGGSASCGGVPQQRTVKKFCTGTTATCDGAPVTGNFGPVPSRPTCAIDQICQLGGASAPTCTDCEFGCSGNACEAAECTSGACCVDGRFAGTTTVCDSDPEYRCDGTCGGRRQERTVDRFCSGNSAACDGPLVPGTYRTLSTCDGQDLCTANGTTAPPTCSDCEFGCSSNACEAPDCTSGACCQSGHFRDDTFVCSTSTEYQCTGTCGGRAQQRTVERRCTGAAAGCTGPITNGPFQNIPNVPACGANDLCEPNGTAQPTCEDCQFGCENNACRQAELWVFLSRSQTAPTFLNRAAADNICRSDYTNPAFPDFPNVMACNVSHIHALIGISAADRAQDMHLNHGVPQNVPVTRYPDAVRMTNQWSGLFSGQLLDPYSTGTAQVFWTGGLNPGLNQTCQGWSSSSASHVGVSGRTTATNNWLGLEAPACTNLQRLMCVCWNQAD